MAPALEKVATNVSISKDLESVSVNKVGGLEFARDEERRLVRKMDVRILPPLAFIGNVGNAKTDGWDKDTGLTGNQYYILVMVFYVPFCLFGTPISLLVKRFTAARVLPILMLGYGSMGLCTAAAKNFSEIFVLRWFLGTFESAMLPGVVFYLSTFYKRDELASRIGIFYAASSISGAFSGLIAFGVFQIKNSKYHGWQYLFWIEGASTIVFSAFAYFWLPRTAATARFFNPREKAIAKSRILSDSSTATDSKLSFRDAFRPFRDWRYLIWAFISLCLGVPLASVNNFLPQIVASLGYSTVKTNLFTVAPNIAGTVVLLILTFSSDYWRERSIHICVPLAITLVGFIILGTIDVLAHRNTAYFACFLLCMGASAPSVLTSSWYSNNTTNESGRAVVAAVMVGIANASGLISTNVFRAQDAPKYLPALITSACFGAVCILLVASLGTYMRLENRRRDRVQGVTLTSAQVDTEALGQDGSRSPLFRYMY
ncbi:MFS general substrate transporter [Neolentinus lepideus HHB14362 ss-1]|uniref:MFS general substrate transporter n=1 Tax=Neolentinus lepideus HHB14362 ss-1 TaxID=1314782 RepID=A0A165W1Y4_9AGAM|nr:MFS general substrate transporter [Neolentinus lepideus HHB14362 ss-1]